jgi:hypothetical protein
MIILSAATICNLIIDGKIMSQQHDNYLLTETQSLISDHLGQSYDLLYELQKGQCISTKYSDTIEKRLTVSLIIHLFCAFESAVNYFWYECFSNEDSPHYVSNKERTFILNKMLESRTRLPILDKFEILVWHVSSQRISDQLAARLKEVNRLRNLIVHGFTYRSRFLVEMYPEQGEASQLIYVDQEHIDMTPKFPNCKFNSLHCLCSTDGNTVFNIIIESLKILSAIFSHAFHFQQTKPRLIITTLKDVI